LDSGFIAYEDITSPDVTLSADDTITLYLEPDLIERRNRPIRSDSLYNRSDSTLIGRNGCAYITVFQFTITQNTNTDTGVSFWVDIGGAIPPLYVRGEKLTRGIGTVTQTNKSTGVYTLDTWEANGGKIKVTTDQEIDIKLNRIITYQIHERYGVPFSN
jgi:hypothetical protein